MEPLFYFYSFLYCIRRVKPIDIHANSQNQVFKNQVDRTEKRDDDAYDNWSRMQTEFQNKKYNKPVMIYNIEDLDYGEIKKIMEE